MIMRILVNSNPITPSIVEAIQRLGGGSSVNVQDDVYSVTYTMHNFKNVPIGFISAVQNLFTKGYVVSGYSRGFNAKPKMKTKTGSVLATFGSLDKPVKFITLSLTINSLD